MDTNLQMDLTKRPQISEYLDMVEYFHHMIEFRRRSEPSFSVLSATKSLRRVSPALISLILKKKRKISLDRVDEFAKLLHLNSQEKYFLKNWISRNEGKTEAADASPPPLPGQRKETSVHILQDWINLYVKDCFQISKIQANPRLIYQCLGHHASASRLDKSLQFLLKEGYLRKTVDGKTVVDTELTVTDPKVPSKKIRQFHKSALLVAKSALDLFPPSERFANTMTIPLNEKSYGELAELIQEFAHKLQDFATQNQDGDRLYQVIVNLSPTGGKFE